MADFQLEFRLSLTLRAALMMDQAMGGVGLLIICA
jgi:hypothetical protein